LVERFLMGKNSLDLGQLRRLYRPEKSVLERPTGESIFIGARLEEALPLLRWAVITEALA